MLIKQALFQNTAIAEASKSLDATVLRSKAIASNMANLMTPGYQRIEVDFESKLKLELDRIRENGRKSDWDTEGIKEAFRRVEPVAHRSSGTMLPGGINNVDVDLEAATMAENRILFQYDIRFIQDEKSLIDSAIRGQSS